METRDERATRMRAYREAHREKLAAKEKAYRAAHKEALASRARVYREVHKEEIAAQRRVYREAHRGEAAAYRNTHKAEIVAREVAYRKSGRDLVCLQASPRRFLSYLLCVVRKRDRHKGCECDLDQSYLADLWDLQGGRCAATGLPMLYQKGSLRSVSIDRLDSSKGHIKGNVQLVCQFYNYGKLDYTDEEARSFLLEMRQLWSESQLREVIRKTA